MNPIFRGDAAFFRALGRGFYLRRPCRGRGLDAADVRRLRRQARAESIPLKDFMREIACTRKHRDASVAQDWLARKAKR